MRPPLALALATMALPSTSAAAPLRLLRLDAGLRAAGERSLEGGILAPPLALPGGGLVAVTGDPGRASLVQVDASGEPRRTALPPLPGPVRAAHLSGDGALVLLAGDELLRLRAAGGQVLERRRLPFAVAEHPAAATAQGAFVALERRLVLARFDGNDAERPLFGPQGGIASWVWLLATGDGGCLVAEQQIAPREVKGRLGRPDPTKSLLLAVLGPSGELRAELRLGEVRTERQWFWREASARDSFLPGPMGLVRTRYQGTVAVEAVGARPGGGFAVAIWEGWGAGTDRRTLLLLGPDLKVAARGDLPAAALAVAGAEGGGALVALDGGGLWALDARARPTLRAAVDLRSRQDGDLPQLALAPGQAGGWLLVEY